MIGLSKLRHTSRHDELVDLLTHHVKAGSYILMCTGAVHREVHAVVNPQSTKTRASTHDQPEPQPSRSAPKIKVTHRISNRKSPSRPTSGSDPAAAAAYQPLRYSSSGRNRQTRVLLRGKQRGYMSYAPVACIFLILIIYIVDRVAREVQPRQPSALLCSGTHFYKRQFDFDSCLNSVSCSHSNRSASLDLSLEKTLPRFCLLPSVPGGRDGLQCDRTLKTSWIPPTLRLKLLHKTAGGGALGAVAKEAFPLAMWHYLD